MIDTHTHLYLPEFEDGGDIAVRHALDAGVEMMVMPNVDLTTVEPLRQLAERWPGVVHMAMGLHPTEVRDSWREDLAAVMSLLTNSSSCKPVYPSESGAITQSLSTAKSPVLNDHYVAVGEVGMDLYWDKTYRDEQMQAFDAQVARAQDLGLPVIIHCREALDEALEVMSAHPEARAVFHSFGGTVEDVERIRNVGDYYFGINGVVTFKNCRVRDSLQAIGLDRLLLETDSPYLAPVPHRGKRNESAYIIHTAAHIASHLGISLDELDARTKANALRLFPRLTP